MEDTSLIADVPRPFSEGNGRVWTGPAYFFARSRRRVKPAIVVGADGSNVNVYSIKTSRLLHSQAFRPQSRLISAPCFVTTRRSTRRFLYVVLRDEDLTAEDQLVCIQQRVRRQQNVQNISPEPERSNVAVGSSEDPILTVAPVVNAYRNRDDRSEFNVLVIQESGQTTCFSSDLRTVKWSLNLGNKLELQGTETRTKYATASIAADYENTLLKKRPDLADSPSPNEGNGRKILQSRLLIGLVTSTSADNSLEKLHFLTICLPDATPISQPILETSHSYSFAPQSKGSTAPMYNIDLSKGLMTRQTREAVDIFDVFQTQPTLLYHYEAHDNMVEGCLPISRTMCILVTQQEQMLVDMQYNSLQARRVLNQHATAGTRKRKRQEAFTTSTPLCALSFFPKQNTVIGLTGQSLATFRLSPTIASTPRVRRNESRLADALGKGLQAPPHVQAIKVDDDLTKLARIFEYRGEQTDHKSEREQFLKVRDTTHDEFQGLVLKGYISPGRVQQALAGKNNHTGIGFDIHPGDICRALAEYDRSLVLNAEVVFTSPTLALPMLMESLKVLLHSFETVAEDSEAKKAVQDVTNLTNGDLENALQAEEESADRDLELATGLLEGGFQVRAHALRICFEKLATCYHLRDVGKAMKNSMTKHEIILLIEILRHELRTGGWTTHTLDDYPKTPSSDQQVHAISAMCSLINCAIDGLGTSVLLPDQTSFAQVDVDSYITEIRNEVSAVLEGVQESSFFDGFLKDFLRYDRIFSDPKQSIGTSKKHGKPQKTPSYMNALVPPAALPIGSKFIERISSTRIGAGGEIQKRSTREMGNKISQQVGAYSFETIRF